MSYYKELHYEQKGVQGESLIFLHGFLGNHHDFKKVKSSFEKKYNCIYIDLPGQGKSGFLAEVQNCPFDTFAKWLDTFIKDKVKAKPHIVGYSMGSRLLIHFLTCYSSCVQSAVFESTSMTPYARESRVMRKFADQGIIRKIKKVGMKKFLEGWYDLEIFRGIKCRSDFSDLMKQRVKNTADKVEKVLNLYSVSNQKDPLEGLKGLPIKAMALYGQHDLKAKKNSIVLKNYIHSLKIEECAGASHNIHWECPNIFINKVQSFLEC